MKITVIGTGYVGLVTGACFSEMGNTVTCIDIDRQKISNLEKGICPIYEPGLEPILKKNIEADRLFFSTAYESISSCKVVFMAVGTPPQEDGSADLSYLYSAIESALPYLLEGSLVVLKSTVPIGTNIAVNRFIRERTKKEIHIVNNPEFLKEGSAVEDFMRPERVIIGTSDELAYKTLEELYAPFMLQKSRTIKMSNLSAEMTKYAANTFLATKISFINEIARLCDVTGADIEEVRSGIASDSRIGGQFLYAGPGYGGACFPKDIRALSYSAKKFGLELEIVNATERVNNKQKLYMFNKIASYFSKDLKGKKIALWGVAFKANTDDIREASAQFIVEALTEAGAEVQFYDPIAAANFEKLSQEKKWNAYKKENKYDCLNEADALLILTEWKEFRSPDFDEIKGRLKTAVIFDGRNLYSSKLTSEYGIEYYAVGKGNVLTYA